MPDFELTPAAEIDLSEIALYTIGRWGSRQADRYAATLEQHFAGIGSGATRTKAMLPNWPEVRVSRCEHHYVFSLQRSNDCPLIVAVFHERMDLMARLRDRIGIDDVGGAEDK